MMIQNKVSQLSRTAQQINGREAETATFSSTCLLSFTLSLAGLRPRQCRRSVARGCHRVNIFERGFDAL
jgi:hypothetical protein